MVRRRDVKWRGKNSKGLIKEVATELDLGTGENSSRWHGEDYVSWESTGTLRKHANVSDAQVTNGKVGETKLECVLGPAGTRFECRADSQLNLVS